MPKELVSRKEVPVKETWDLSLIYETEEAMQADLEKVKKLTAEVVTRFKGNLTTPETVNACLDEMQEINRLVGLIINYTDLNASVDYCDAHLQEVNATVQMAISELFSKLSFVESEISRAEETVIRKAMEQSEDNRFYLDDILRYKPFQLDPETERVLAALSPVLNAPYNLYNTTKLADIQFENFEANGTSHPLGYSLFEDHYEFEPDTETRRAAFRAFSDKIRQYENSTAAIYQTHLQHEKIMSNLRGYDSVFDYLLMDQKVDRSLYDRQIDLIMEKLAPHMRKYARLIKKVHNLSEMTYADLKLPLDPDYNPTVTIEGSEDYISKALAVMGEDYVKMVHTAYKERWIDFAQNKGKSTGGFCASPYGKNSFILLSWHEQMSDVFVLAHELGHAGHFKACNTAQSLFNTNVSGYFVEAPSTMNELLLANYLKSTSDDKRFTRWVLSNLISNTYYHNFVTHLLEAAYQREVYRIIDAGGSVQAETLDKIMKETLTKFWGEDVVLTDGAELTWMRQPHYYMGLYSYTYSAGLTVATQVSKRIEKEGQPAVDDWKEVLKAGSTLDPVGLAKLAKVDITTDEPLLDTIETIGGIIDEICRLTDELQE